MHKRLVNHCTIEFSLMTDGPILVKSGKEGADPTKPDMEFVETYRAGGRTIYLPGSGLKGAIRAHSERIVRTVGRDRRDASKPDLLWANDPLHDDYKYLEKQASPEIHKRSSYTDRLFGNTSLASRLRIEDAYPVGEVKLEERNGVAIDRVFGSVAVGPFNYQVCTVGEFATKIHLKNFTLGQLGLLGLVLRDLDDGWFGIGFAKSRGLGSMKVKFDRATVQYPGCILTDDRQIRQLGHDRVWAGTTLLGAGEFLDDGERQSYGFPSSDIQTGIPVSAQAMEYGMGVELRWTGEEVQDLFIRSVKAWSRLLQGAAA
ncbi:RAMP superfamily CRISPR-associated protein [Chamaesiphon sp.]|uniref:RAMP superfamily CRISPR-associated protein n=1 Tax=Chamaesiphon sp. TaxID=2814140 RepID=UPI0035934D01